MPQTDDFSYVTIPENVRQGTITRINRLLERVDKGPSIEGSIKSYEVADDERIVVYPAKAYFTQAFLKILTPFGYPYFAFGADYINFFKKLPTEPWSHGTHGNWPEAVVGPRFTVSCYRDVLFSLDGVSEQKWWERQTLIPIRKGAPYG